MRQTALLVREGEDDARLVCLCQRTEHVSLVGIRYHEETCVVMLVVLDMIFQHL